MEDNTNFIKQIGNLSQKEKLEIYIVGQFAKQPIYYKFIGYYHEHFFPLREKIEIWGIFELIEYLENSKKYQNVTFCKDSSNHILTNISNMIMGEHSLALIENFQDENEIIHFTGNKNIYLITVISKFPLKNSTNPLAKFLKTI